MENKLFLVLGCGIAGLEVANLLLGRQYRVKIIAEYFPDDEVSGDKYASL
jgi:hypothetical protein